MRDTHSGVRTARVDQVIDTFGRCSRYLALLVAWVALCGSLFFSEVLHWQPCLLCWYQRILMYPLSLVIAVGILRRDAGLHWYILPLSLLGAGVSLYHYLLVKTDWFPPPPCVADIPCTVDYLNVFGFINIPFLALTAFLLISFLAVASMLTAGDDVDGNDLAPHDARPSTRRHVLLSGTSMAVIGIVGTVVAAFVIAAQFV
jgi:disulfide bond formation protein DsbB